MKHNAIIKGWAFQWKDGSLALPVKGTRKELISYSEEYFDSTWKKLRRWGHKAVKVEVRPV